MRRFSKPFFVVGALVVVFSLAFTLIREQHIARQAEAVDRMTAAAQAFLEALEPAQREQATFDFDDEERKTWSNLPAPLHKRGGISFGEMSIEQKEYAHRLFQTVLSSQGYLKVIGIMHLDDILKEFSNFKAPNGEEAFGSEKYWIAVFDTPSADTHWGWQLDGHHLALNFTIADGEIAVTPAFMGTEPHEVRVGPYAGWRILGEEDDQGLAFIKNLDTEQRKQAQLEAEAPRDIFTGPGRGDALKTMSGLPASAMTRDQQGQLLNLIGEYAQNLEHELAHVQMDRIRRAGIENLHFGWMGPIEPGPKDRYYYRIHGPTLLIEFDNSPPPGPGNGDVNHIHSVWRDLENDYGQDLLKQHYETSPHHQN